MVLTTHLIAGAAVAQVLPNNPAIGFTAGFISHFLLDSIPHWDYPLHSAKRDLENPLNSDIVLNKYFLLDIIKIGIDFLLGFSVFMLVFNIDGKLSWQAFWGAFGGVIPDFLQFAYFKLRKQPLTGLQRFHSGIQKNKHLKNHPILGIFIQIILIIVIVSFVKFVI